MVLKLVKLQSLLNDLYISMFECERIAMTFFLLVNISASS